MAGRPCQPADAAHPDESGTGASAPGRSGGPPIRLRTPLRPVGRNGCRHPQRGAEDRQSFRDGYDRRLGAGECVGWTGGRRQIGRAPTNEVGRHTPRPGASAEPKRTRRTSTGWPEKATAGRRDSSWYPVTSSASISPCRRARTSVLIASALRWAVTLMMTPPGPKNSAVSTTSHPGGTSALSRPTYRPIIRIRSRGRSRTQP